MKHICTSFTKLRIDDEIILTIGNFDGIHKGHGDILSRIKNEAQNLNLKTAILSFDPHPKVYFNDEKNFLINSKSKKLSTLQNMGIDYLIVIHGIGKGILKRKIIHFLEKNEAVFCEAEYMLYKGGAVEIKIN